MADKFRISTDHGEALKDLEKEINRLRELLAQKPTGAKPGYSGLPGGIQVVKKDDGSVALQVKTEQGWHETAPLTLQEK
ncbi:MAG: hypothetical protein P4L35_12235 [Ignavibacteriaceae bacterium]|jgi:hypothetical protein|nr:hypothetical protein [Ignavibacteriaceae bacterium]